MAQQSPEKYVAQDYFRDVWHMPLWTMDASASIRPRVAEVHITSLNHARTCRSMGSPTVSKRPWIGDTWTRSGRMQREIIRVEPIDSNFEKWGAPVSTCTRAGNMVFVSGMPPFDPETGEILVHAPFERQVELILEQVKKALEAAGSDLDHVLKCNVLCISADRFKAFNEVYKRYFPKNPPARIFFCVPEWTGPFDVEVDCVAVTKD
jgi:2-iminobutanoate/2-iminopropanoate deaminase